MKKLLLPLLASLLLAPGALFGATFEGRVTFKMSTPKDPSQEMRYAIKGDKVRVELPNQKEMGGMIMDLGKREMIMIMDSQRMYMVMPMQDQPAGGPGKKAQSEPKLEKTGETQKILGYLAEKYLSTHEGTTTEMWLAEGIGAFAGLGQPSGKGRGNAPQAWERALSGKPYFPLRVIGRDKGGKETFRMEATAIDKQPLGDDVFAAPAGYEKMDMGGMMRGMLPGLPGMPKR